jgi:hypothetical protein
MNRELEGNYRDPAAVASRYVPERSGKTRQNARIADVASEIRT